MRVLILVMALAACSEAAPSAPARPAAPMYLLTAKVSDWQAASDATRQATARNYAHIAFPTARDDQLDELGRKFVICMDHSALTAAAGDAMFDIAQHCEEFVA